VDSAGRRVEVPVKIDRVFVAGGPASVFIYTLAPDKLLGWNRPLTPEERAYIPPRYAKLPTLGRLTGRGNTANVEVMLAARPDVIIDYGSVNPTYVSLADRVQQQTGVPYLLFDGSLSQIPRAYAAAGEALGVGERAKELARYAEGLLNEIDERLARVPIEQSAL
jgi:iron complex transport system substrate-binding protein